MTIDDFIGRQSARWLRVRESNVLDAANVLFLGGERDLVGSTQVFFLSGLFPPISLGVGYRGNGQLIAARRRRHFAESLIRLQQMSQYGLWIAACPSSNYRLFSPFIVFLK
ncbi:hypothetical protein P171DRAFT_486963 [Karstenula rhodostoma CBS 690.94]|uniref:Uncharacterized protein n=1 Tax=Karstenula rhodostoma CBS 690.94 TaxID=1392251 RepID=A0A9P4PDF7_9PLEO|nr:hypothetical protein P171DRAFT_486963 [Karstenula rhodostoma CBS 690.94]